MLVGLCRIEASHSACRSRSQVCCCWFDDASQKCLEENFTQPEIKKMSKEFFSEYERQWNVQQFKVKWMISFSKPSLYTSLYLSNSNFLTWWGIFFVANIMMFDHKTFPHTWQLFFHVSFHTFFQISYEKRCFYHYEMCDFWTSSVNLGCITKSWIPFQWVKDCDFFLLCHII